MKKKFSYAYNSSSSRQTQIIDHKAKAEYWVFLQPSDGEDEVW